jgi:hypothetical protein
MGFLDGIIDQWFRGDAKRNAITARYNAQRGWPLAERRVRER